MTARDSAVLARAWSTEPRWTGIERTYSAEDVVRLSGSLEIRHTLAEHGAARLWDLLHDPDRNSSRRSAR